MVDFCSLNLAVIYQACMGRCNSEDPSASILPHHGQRKGLTLDFVESLAEGRNVDQLRPFSSTPLASMSEHVDIKGRQ